MNNISMCINDDDECGCLSWTKLAKYLVNLAQEKGYKIYE